MNSTLGNFLRLLPKNLLSYIIGHLVQCPLPPPLARWSVAWFAKRYKIDLAEAEFPVTHYKTIGQLFTRQLKPGLRPISGEVVHPADAKITERGKITAGQLIQAKGLSYTLQDFLQADAASFNDGYFLTYYLCPTDYHRVHSPVDGHIEFSLHVPGQLWPVNPWSVNNIKNLFPRNERVIIGINTEKGPIRLVMVGATNVGKISLSYTSEITTNTQFICPPKKQINHAPPIAVKRGDELGIFNMGSTVIMIYPPGYLHAPPAANGPPIITRLGTALA